MKKNMMPVITTKIVEKSSINDKPIFLKPRKMSKSYFWLKYILSTIIL